jgi:hypothetical protein
MQHIGCYATEEGAARAQDFAAVQVHGPGAKRNFPGETISEPPATMGDEWRERMSLRYIGAHLGQGLISMGRAAV